jgi:metal-sulfur cluster biosynthetic enzyme
MGRYETAYAALDAVVDPELDEPITALGFVRSLVVSPGGNIKVHLRLPTSFCAPNFAYLMASDAKDVLTKLDWARRVVVELDDHHDSSIINAGLAGDAGYRGTFGHEAEESLDELRETFRRKAHTAAMERCLTDLLRADPQRTESSMGDVRLVDLPDGATTKALLRRRRALGLSTEPGALVMVDHLGRGCAPGDVPLALRRARSTRISIDGNAHFCRGLLRTRYGEAEANTFIPLTMLMTKEGALR